MDINITRLKKSGTAGCCGFALMCVKQNGACVHACVYYMWPLSLVSFDIVLLRLAVQI